MRSNSRISVIGDSGPQCLVKQRDSTDLDILLSDNNTCKYKIGSWNLNGFSSNDHPENTVFKCDVMNNLNFDAIFLSETFCKHDDVISVPNFKVIQFNRRTISRRAVRGSGGCAIALSNRLLSNHVIVATYYGKQDGILAVKLRCTQNDALIGLLSNYLPPDSYRYGKDPESYFVDSSLVMSDLSDCDLIVAGGDLNARTRNDLDYIPDVDDVAKVRTNPDVDKNQHGNFFLQYLKDNCALILNGRVTPEENNFTFLNPRGRSVPDYMYCPTDHIQYCVSCKVLPVSDIINDLDLPVPHSLPDHSVIMCEFDLFSFLPRTQQPCKFDNVCEKPRKNIRKINDKFMCSEETVKLITSTISRIESDLKTQDEIDQIYSDVKSIFVSEIGNLPNIQSASSKHGKRALRKAAPFWNSELQQLWQYRCDCEKYYLSFKCDPRNVHHRQEKKELLDHFKQAQKNFDGKFKVLKRQYQYKSFHKLADLADKASNDPTEMWKRLKALSDAKNSHVLLEVIRNDGTISKDKKEVLLKWHDDFEKCFKGMKDDPDLVFDDDFLDEVTKLKDEFDKLLPEEQVSNSPFDSSALNNDITYEEVSNAIDKAKCGKAFLVVPNEAMKNPEAKLLLHKMFNICFQTGLSPTDWLKSDTKPLFKGGEKDPRNPLDHRPLCIMSCIAKIYSCVLNVRLQNHLNSNNLLSDTQNGFRAGRSCIDHIYSLVTILRNRKSENKQTFLCFVDFRRAFDSVNHVLLFHILSSKFGIAGKMYNSLLSLYRDPQTRIVLTSPNTSDATEYFKCPLGVKQGDILSPTMFSMFVHSLTVELEQSGLGVRLDLPPSPWSCSQSSSRASSSLLVNHLIYADDLVCIAENPNDLQSLINIVNLWCCKHRLEANLLKTEVMHVRQPLVPRTKFNFKFGQRKINLCQSYKYLGLTINQFLDFGKMSNSFSDPASRALSAVICKMIKNKGFPFNVFEMLYDCCVTSVCDYAHDVISFPQYSGSDQIHTKAIRSYLGVGRSANLCAIRYAISLLEPRSRASIKMLRFYFRLLNINIYLNVIYIILATWSRFVRLLSNFNLFPIMICLIHFVRSLLFLASPSGPITSSSDLKAIYSQGNQLCTL